MTSNKEKMLRMVLESPKLQEEYSYEASEYNDLYSALNSSNVLVSTVANIIKDLDGAEDESDYRKVYKSIINHINGHLIS